ncbi:MAG: ATP-binding cassette domain-containing protein [Thiotrichales bacterium]|nr:MAG: ATP-binding cassette domain-containing protein [Thiotrichales bacterium]
MTTTAMLRLEDLKIPSLEPVNLMVASGECIGLSGESGCGKTRLLRAIADMDEHDGQVYAEDIAQDQVRAHEWRRRVALLPAESLWWFDTVEQHFSAHQPHIGALGFEPDVMQWQVSRCSSGEKQRLSILRLLSGCPRVLLLDEPTANLDAGNAGRVEELIRNYLAEHNAIAIWVGHDAEQLTRVSQRQFRIRDGRIDGMDEA